MIQITPKTILSDKNNMNVYRGCTHGCIYCDSRSECYKKTYTFEDVEVKTNAPELLEKALFERQNKAVITTGAMSDPYLPLESKLCLTRSCLEVIDKYGFGAALLTKSDLVLRDLDLLTRIHHRSKCVVQMTLTTYDEALCRKLEPNAPVTARRFEALRELKKAGIPTVVWLTPILPLINDTEENIRGILSYCCDAAISGLITFGIGMTLRYGSREYYYKKLDEYFPGLKREYMLTYGYAYGIKSKNNRKLSQIIKNTCDKNQIIYGTGEVFSFVSSLPSDTGMPSLQSPV